MDGLLKVINKQKMPVQHSTFQMSLKDKIYKPEEIPKATKSYLTSPAEMSTTSTLN